MSSLDLALIAGRFLADQELPKSKSYLLKYFPEAAQRSFLVYYFEFGSLHRDKPGRFYRNYMDHTGVACTPRIIQKWSKRARTLESMLEIANDSLDFETIAAIKSGDYRLP